VDVKEKPPKKSLVPPAVIDYLAQQLGTTPEIFAGYGDRPHTRTDHLQEVTAYLGFRKARPGDLGSLMAWLVERALEHDRPTLLLQLACEKLRTDQIVRPGPTRLVSNASWSRYGRRPSKRRFVS
jgi:hypothetical protein